MACKLYEILCLGLRPIVFIKLVPPESSEVFLGTELGDLSNLILCQLKLGKLGKIAIKSLDLVARSKSNGVLINDPSQADLRLCHAVLLGQLCVERVNRPTFGCDDRGKGAVSRHGNVVLLVEIEEITMLKIRVILDLINGRLDLGCLQDGLEVHLQEVGHADGLGPSRLLDLLQFRPSLLKVLIGLGKPGAVDQVEVHVFETKLLEGNVKGINGGTLLFGRDLCGNIKLFSGNTACFDGLSKLFLISVDY